MVLSKLPRIMSKKNSFGGNTLFNYFKKVGGDSPKASSSRLNSDNIPPTSKNGTPKRRKDSSEEEDMLNVILPVKRKRLINALDSENSDAENEAPDSTPVKSSGQKKHPKKLVDSDEESDESVSTPAKKFARKKTTKKSFDSDDESEGSVCTPIKKFARSNTKKSVDSDEESTPKKSTLNTPKKQSKISVADNEDDESETWLHNRLEFLKPHKIRDKNGKSPNHPEYDGRTLYIPNDFLEKQTPGMRQWWIMKRDHFDCILFFKVGKFYELYHMDAVIGVQVLGLSFMKGEWAHSGFPETAYGRMLSSLVEHDYRVARIEQTENPEMMAERMKNIPAGKRDKVVRREICQITNRATRIQGLQDTDLKQPMSVHLLAVLENQREDTIELGVCFVDTSISKFYLGQFEDDERFSRLLTLIAQYPPAMILEERKQLSSQTRNVLKSGASDASLEKLYPEKQFHSSSTTLRKMKSKKYFLNTDTEKHELPLVIQEMINEDDPLNETCKKEFDLALRCLGACMWFLEDCLLDQQLFTLGCFEHYIPADLNIGLCGAASKFMVLDSCTLSSLNILGQEHSLESTLDYCSTSFGKRLLRQWICRPICNITEINNRQDAIKELLENPSVMDSAIQILSSLPDLERLISKIHWMGNALYAKNHPDSRAILYEEKTYSKKKIKDCITTLGGFEKAMSLCELFSDVNSKMLKQYICLGSRNGLFPNLMDTIEFFKNSFNAEEAAKDGKIIPQYGVDSDYDEIIDEIESIKEKLSKYLESQQKYFGCKLNYFGTDKKRYQLEVPQHATSKANKNYYMEGTKKGTKPVTRYTTNETKSLLAQMIAAENKCNEVLHDLNRKIFEKFSTKYDDWSIACHCLAVLDVLISLTVYIRNQNVAICIPEILPSNAAQQPILVIKDGIHPLIKNVDSFVPNATELGTNNNSPVLILTGPNMGGKSTLMRQVALLTIMAQMGCHVPASEMKLSLVDRVFTRIGAHDDIMTRNSTFLVELREAVAILQHSTRNSLVFVDELGRGTSTYDGTAIATAYVDFLIRKSCRTVFSTHYYSLVDHFKSNNAIQLCHMACKVESDEDDATQETVIFMYKMIGGPCPKSYGFNAARLAGIPGFITKRAHQISQKFQVEADARKMFQKMFLN